MFIVEICLLIHRNKPTLETDNDLSIIYSIEFHWIRRIIIIKYSKFVSLFLRWVEGIQFYLLLLSRSGFFFVLLIDQERHTRTDTFIYAERSNTMSAAVFYDLVAGYAFFLPSFSSSSSFFCAGVLEPRVMSFTKKTSREKEEKEWRKEQLHKQSLFQCPYD